MLGRQLGGTTQPGIDVLVGRGEQRFELVQTRLIQSGLLNQYAVAMLFGLLILTFWMLR